MLIHSNSVVNTRLECPRLFSAWRHWHTENDRTARYRIPKLYLDNDVVIDHFGNFVMRNKF